MDNHRNDLTAEEIRGLVGDGPTMLEVGCHDGTHTRKFLKAMPNIRLFCWEPDPRPLRRFYEKIGYDRRVTIYPDALGNVDGLSPFYASTGKVGRHGDYDCSGSPCKPTGHLDEHPSVKFKPSEPLPFMRLDTWGLDNTLSGPIDFAWVDCQGSQRGFIAGGRLTLAITRYLYIEVHHNPMYEGEPTQDELIALLPGFEPLATYARDNILFKNRHDLT